MANDEGKNQGYEKTESEERNPAEGRVLNTDDAPVASQSSRFYDNSAMTANGSPDKATAEDSASTEIQLEAIRTRARAQLPPIRDGINSRDEIVDGPARGGGGRSPGSSESASEVTLLAQQARSSRQLL